MKATVLAQLATRHKGILLFHDIQPSTAQSIGEILAALKERGYKVVHLVPKAPVATLAAYDARADSEIGGRRLAEAKEPLAPRSVVWAQSDSGKSDAANDTTEVLPWTAPAKPTPTKTSAVAKRAGGAPWYMQWWP